MCHIKFRVTLSANERAELKIIVTDKNNSKLSSRRAYLLVSLYDALTPALSDDNAAKAPVMKPSTLQRVRGIFVLEGFVAALQGKPRTDPPTPPKMDGELDARLVHLACSMPQKTMSAGVCGCSPRDLWSWPIPRGSPGRRFAACSEKRTQALAKSILYDRRGCKCRICVRNGGGVLEVYHQPYNPMYPVVWMDESPCQLIGEAGKPFRDSNGVEHVDYQYVRSGVASVLAALEPLAGLRPISVRDSHKTADFVEFMREIAVIYPLADKITVVMDNLSTHKKSGYYKCMPPQAAKELADRFEFGFTPKHGSWINMAEIGLRILKKECLGKRMPDKATMEDQKDAWFADKNNTSKKTDWQFPIEDARVKLKRLYQNLGV